MELTDLRVDVHLLAHQLGDVPLLEPDDAAQQRHPARQGLRPVAAAVSAGAARPGPEAGHRRRTDGEAIAVAVADAAG